MSGSPLLSYITKLHLKFFYQVISLLSRHLWPIWIYGVMWWSLTGYTVTSITLTGKKVTGNTISCHIFILKFINKTGLMKFIYKTGVIGIYSISVLYLITGVDIYLLNPTTDNTIKFVNVVRSNKEWRAAWGCNWEPLKHTPLRFITLPFPLDPPQRGLRRLIDYCWPLA